ncbi:MAG: hypothetical protein R3198_05795 [Marinobacter sp.]|nr:hypothetical protein [Marinobacter sp.]
MMEPENKALFEGLQALSDSAFPKKCSNCGRLYHSPEEFLTRSQAIPGKSGLKESLDDDDSTIVEVFRNCECGSTLLDFFEDRRDTSEKGNRRREVFGKMLVLLQDKGLSIEEAREELKGVMNGKPSERLAQLGIRLKTPGCGPGTDGGD